MTDPERARQNRDKTRRYRERMWAEGFREIVVWATPAQTEAIREMVKDNTPLGSQKKPRNARQPGG